jgi:indolepyruvate ferredoxin oxidoreductase
VALLSVPEKIRGYGHVKDAHLARAKPEQARLLAAFRGSAPVQAAAE